MNLHTPSKLSVCLCTTRIADGFKRDTEYVLGIFKLPDEKRLSVTVGIVLPIRFYIEGVRLLPG